MQRGKNAADIMIRTKRTRPQSAHHWNQRAKLKLVAEIVIFRQCDDFPYFIPQMRKYINLKIERINILSLKYY